LSIAQYFPQYQGVIPTAGILTLCLFGGLTLAAFVTRKDFSFLAPILSIAGFLLMGLILIAVIFPNFVNLGLWFSFLAVGLAAGSILYTTSNIIHHYSLDMHVAAALELFAGVALLFMYVLRILMQMRSR
jgi:FtsH-binding integral membrane protein